MKRYLVCFCLCGLLISACQPAPIPVTGAQNSPTIGVQPSVSITAMLAEANPRTVTTQPALENTPRPAGWIRVDTLEQEVYPFVENQRCSLAEAIVAANLKKPVDSCPAGGEDQSVIDLMPGTYHLSQIDATPQQVEWAASTTGTGDALPAVVRSLTLRGNGAVLVRQDAKVPFRILEVLSGTVTLENITLQGGEVQGKDWGGALLVQNASLVMDGVTVRDSRAENGGGVYFTNGGLSVRNSLFFGNEALFSGGGLYAGQTRADITNSRFIENKSEGLGAGVFIEEAFLSLADSIFIGNHSESRGGGINLQVVNASILRSQFYRNYAKLSGAGVSGRNYLYEKDIAAAEADPMEKVIQSDTYAQMATQIPGFRETLVAQPSGMYVQRKLDIQVHESCFMGNTNESQDPADTSTAIAGRTASENNYYGDPSGPSGMGNGTGESISREVAFEPFLSAPPAYCDLALAKK
jgi:hypothetical protein